MKIEIKSIFGSVLFEYDCENNTIRKTLEEAIIEAEECWDFGGDGICFDANYAKLVYSNNEIHIFEI